MSPSTCISLGSARLHLEPPWPPLWQSLARQAPGPASLCLAILPLTRPDWEGVAGADGCPVPCALPAWAALPTGLLPRLLPALCPPWLNPEEEAELAALEGYLRTRADFPGLDCAACQEQEAQGEGAPDCAACPRPQPPASARVALGLEPLLAAGQPALAQLAGSWLGDLPPREAWLLAWRLALLTRWRDGGTGPSCPPLGGRGNI